MADWIDGSADWPKREYIEINNRFICYPFQEHCSPKLTSNCRKTVHSTENMGGFDPTCHPPTHPPQWSAISGLHKR